MSLLQRLLGRVRDATAAPPPATTAVPAWAEDREWLRWPAPLNIVRGESHYQAALRRLAGPPREGGWCVPVDLALQREEDNPHDPDAIAVLAGGRRVGYITADLCSDLAVELDQAGRNARMEGVPGVIRGGWPDKPHLGVMVWLNLPEVREALAGFDWELCAGYEARSWPPGPRPPRGDAPAATGRWRTAARPVGCEPRMPPLTEHYTAYVEDVKELKRRGRLDDAAALLLALIDAVEAEGRDQGVSVAPWYYEQLAIVRRKQKDPDGEIAVLARYLAQRHGPGGPDERLAERLARARQRQAGTG